ncbi:unannotated protein [freshwater metagenome]|uniref:Unannotated protein n=1 Tax=freshwater metagenome TaxID=449393 RepID=A0A6J6JPT0_9ZZZZ|nr:hypothetical protein [Actinomycetota bacterium]
MATVDDNDAVRKHAAKSIRKKRDFKQYLVVYALVSALLTGIWFMTDPIGGFWPIWAMFGMGIAAVFIGLDAYGLMSAKPITEADIDAEVERLKTKG